MRGRAAICGAIAWICSLNGLVGLAPSCSAKNVVVDVPIVAYVPAACGDATGAQVTFTGLGDFPQPTQAGELVRLDSTGVALTALPPASREVVISPLTDDAVLWAGLAEVPDAGTGAVSVLTLPLDDACRLTGSPAVGPVAGAFLGMVDATHAMLLGSTAPPYLIDLGTGKVTQLAPQLALPTTDATLTPFGSGALLAGGQNGQAEGFATARLYVPGPAASPGSFDAPTSAIPLPSNQREKHAAVTLPDGRVLLIGGVTDRGEPVVGIDLFDPRTPTVPQALSATLHAPNGRAHPTVIALPNGQVFIGGGLDANGEPVASVEWLDASLAWAGEQALCSAASAQGFAATEGGAVLVVMGQAATAGCSNVHLVRQPGEPVQDAPPLDVTPTNVTLFEGAQASPVLVTEAGALRWNPWTGRFSALGPTGDGAEPTSASLAVTTGLALWLGHDSHLWTLRFDTHGVYATDTAHGPYLVTDDEYTAPDRLLPLDAGFSPASGATLAHGTTVWVTDETFAGVTASVTLPRGGAATLVLRQPDGSEVTCSAADVLSSGSIQVVRDGASLRASATSGSVAPCAGVLDAQARVAVGVRGPSAGSTTLRGLSVLR